MSRAGNPFREKALPGEAGHGWRFVRVGELIKRGDQFWCTTLGKWMPATALFTIVTAVMRNRYRRRANA